MKKIILASASSIALLGLAACSDTDTTTTQSIEPEVQETAPTVVPQGSPTLPTDEAAPATDNTTTQSIQSDDDMDTETEVRRPLEAEGQNGSIVIDGVEPAPADDVTPADDVPVVQ